jgi:hypothetical protein
MAILTMFEVHGDPDEILATQEEKIVAEARRLAAENGGVWQTVVKTENGVMMLNLWDNEEGMRRVAEQIRPVAEEAGLEQVGWRQYEVLRHRAARD